MRRAFITLAAVTAFAISPLWAGDWPSFRGPAGDGIANETSVPVEWSKDKNVKWRAELPQPGNGSPIVSNGRVFVACAQDAKGTQRSLYCFDRQDGKQLWVKTVKYDKVEETHQTNPYCGSTPAADGKHVVVWHGSAGLHCYNFEGQMLWSRDLGEFPHIWGYGTSPILYQDQVIMHCGPGPRVFLAAFDLASGKSLWTTEEPVEGDGSYNNRKRYTGSWSTPLIVPVKGKDQIICAMSTRVVGYDPADGKILWWCNGVRSDKGDLAYSSPSIAGDICVLTGGFGGPGLAFRIGGSGDITETNRLWRTERNPQSIGSGVVVGDYYYRPNAGPGTIECMDPKTGKILWQDRAGGGTYWGSMVYVDGRCYVTSQAGVTVVFRPNPEKFESLANNNLGEPSNATPAVSDGEIFLRTHRGVFCIADKQQL